MVANKLTGQKGVLFTAAYVTAFEQMRERIKTGKALPDDESRKLRAPRNGPERRQPIRPDAH